MPVQVLVDIWVPELQSGIVSEYNYFTVEFKPNILLN
jgi:hypothetical protein